MFLYVLDNFLAWILIISFRPVLGPYAWILIIFLLNNADGRQEVDVSGEPSL